MTAVAAPPVTEIARADLAGALRLPASIKAKAVTLRLGDELAVTAATFDVAAVVTLPAAGGEGEITVPRAALAGILACCDSSLRLSVEDKVLVIASGPATYRLPADRPPPPRRVGRRGRATPVTIPPAEPLYGHDLDAGPVTDVVTMEAPVLVEALRRALPFAGDDFTRPLLCIVAFSPGRHTMAATDSYRLAIIRYGDDHGPANETPWLLHRDGVLSLVRMLAKKLGQVELWQTETHIHARFENVRWSMRRVDGKYPDYEKLLPDEGYDGTLKVDRVDLLAGARAALVTCQRNEPLRLTVGVECTVAAGIQNGAVTRRLDSAAFEGDGLEIGLNPQFLADIAAAAPVERLTCRFLSPLRPMMVEAARDLYLLMPIRLNV